MFRATICPSLGENTRNTYRKAINILRKIVHQVVSIYNIIQGCTVNKRQNSNSINPKWAIFGLCYCCTQRAACPCQVTWSVWLLHWERRDDASLCMSKWLLPYVYVVWLTRFIMKYVPHSFVQLLMDTGCSVMGFEILFANNETCFRFALLTL